MDTDRDMPRTFLDKDMEKDTDKDKDTDTDTDMELETFATCYISTRRYGPNSAV